MTIDIVNDDRLLMSVSGKTADLFTFHVGKKLHITGQAYEVTEIIDDNTNPKYPKQIIQTKRQNPE